MSYNKLQLKHKNKMNCVSSKEHIKNTHALEVKRMCMNTDKDINTT